MMRRTRRLILLVVSVSLLITAGLLFANNCPSAGIALTSNARYLHSLKNRTAFPSESDFDSRVTLDELLRPGDDSNRWSINRAARIQGYVINVHYAGIEAANCFSPCRRDIHILVARQKDALKTEQVVVEVTPNFRGWAASQGMDWTEESLRAQLIGHWCEFEGWLYYDAGHSDEAENTAAQNSDNWRATAWEVHPITKITVIR